MRWSIGNVISAPLSWLACWQVVAAATRSGCGLPGWRMRLVLRTVRTTAPLAPTAKVAASLGHCTCHPFATLHNRITCGEGCGDLYWGEWHSDPPDPCDPCDEYCGNYVGERCCPPPWRRRLTGLLLGRRCCNLSCDADCDQCVAGNYDEGFNSSRSTNTKCSPCNRACRKPSNRRCERSANGQAFATPDCTLPAPADETPRLDSTLPSPEARRAKPGSRTISFTERLIGQPVSKPIGSAVLPR